tara:strand:- start:579 stop:707 length:129 start_codon:yes stop_codon:yes gene_type:complete
MKVIFQLVLGINVSHRNMQNKSLGSHHLAFVVGGGVVFVRHF